MYIRIVKNITLNVWIFDEEGGDTSFCKTFAPGEVYAVELFSEDGHGCTCLAILGLGIVEMPNDAWAERFWFAPCLN